MLKRLTVRNLGPIEEAVLTGDTPVNLLLGPNESGKTTLLEALEVLNFGTRGGVEVKGNAALTRAGAKGWGIECEFEDGEIFKATRSQRPLREDLQTRFGDPRVFLALTQTGTFLTMKPAERKQLLADLSASDTLALAEDLQKRKVDPAIVTAVRAGKMRRAHSLAVEQRRNYDRKIRAVAELAEGDVPNPEMETKKGSLTIDKVPLATIEDGVKRLSKRRDEIRAAGFALESYERAERDAVAAKADLDDLTAEANWVEADATRLLEVIREIETMRRECMHASSEIEAASKLHRELSRLMSEVGPCPTCGAELQGDSAQEALSEARKECTKRLNGAKKVQEENSTKDLEVERKALTERKETAQALATTRGRMEEKLRVAEEHKKPDMPGGDLDTLNTEISRLNAMRDVRREYDTRTDDKARAAERLKVLVAPRDEMAALEKELDPSAIADEEAILTEINGHLAQTCGKLGVPVVLNDGYEISIHGRAVGLASDSARLRAGFGVACALSVLAGVGFAFLDRFEALDDDNRKRVLKLLKGLTDDGLLSWVLVAAVKKNPKRGAPVPWLSWISVDNGTVTYLGD